ncbi:hypothetical protein J437_LFUL018641 [Ladona fulva]|uniref:Uncharacterized protein n=1 Tax=Ladona fulva TaxID=123851 RepID=A0A8K0KQP1_LADFU|nr:hypothetical protein J437_LFUL018641 [Ladona fulva]
MVNREPYVSTADLANQINETAEEFYERCHFVMKKIVEDTGKGGKGGNVLVVAHAANLDTCTRQLTGSLPRSSDEMRRFCQRVPYCSVAMVSEIVPQSVGDGKRTEESSWKLSEPPFPPLTHSPNLRFDWKVLLS